MCVTPLNLLLKVIRKFVVLRAFHQAHLNTTYRPDPVCPLPEARTRRTSCRRPGNQNIRRQTPSLIRYHHLFSWQRLITYSYINDRVSQCASFQFLDVFQESELKFRLQFLDLFCPSRVSGFLFGVHIFYSFRP